MLIRRTETASEWWGNGFCGISDLLVPARVFSLILDIHTKLISDPGMRQFESDKRWSQTHRDSLKDTCQLTPWIEKNPTRLSPGEHAEERVSGRHC